jgi:anhydro-N-acetylmuramic acid kinase
LNSKTDDFEPIWSLGFMSGTSLDAVDAAMILTDGETIFEFGPATARTYTEEERAVLQRATDAARKWNWGKQKPTKAFQLAEEVISVTHLKAARQLFMDPDCPHPAILGIHGQTVLHRAATPQQKGQTLQLLNAHDIVEAIDKPVAYDFRTDDVEAGGQGAPLAPAYHAALLKNLSRSKAEGPPVAVNLGGVANITGYTPAGEIIACDVGPANGPIDEWVERHGKGRYDADGAFARQGTVDEDRVALIMDRPFFTAPAPKSLDRYDFNADLANGLSFEDGCATLTYLTAQAVAHGVSFLLGDVGKIILCGGGRYNATLKQMLAEALQSGELLTAEDVGWRGDSVEAEAFAFLAVRTLRGLPISWPLTTGAPSSMTGGKILAVDAD